MAIPRFDDAAEWHNRQRGLPLTHRQHDAPGQEARPDFPGHQARPDQVRQPPGPHHGTSIPDHAPDWETTDPSTMITYLHHTNTVILLGSSVVTESVAVDCSGWVDKVVYVKKCFIRYAGVGARSSHRPNGPIGADPRGIPFLCVVWGL